MVKSVVKGGILFTLAKSNSTQVLDLKIEICNLCINKALPEMEVCEGVVVEDEGMEMNKASHLGRESFQLVVPQVEIKKICAVHQYLCWDFLNTVGQMQIKLLSSDFDNFVPSIKNHFQLSDLVNMTRGLT